MSKKRAPEGQIETFAREHFEHGGFAHDIYRKGRGPAVIVITEIPGISPHVLGFADRLVSMGLTAVLPSLFGTPGRDIEHVSSLERNMYMLPAMAKLCVSREFNLFAAGKSSPVVDYLRALARREHERCGGPGVGVGGMCFSGGFALAMATEPSVLAPVMSQPGLPFRPLATRSAFIDCSAQELATIKARCDNEGLRVLGLRFDGDPIVPAQRFQHLREQLGDGFVCVELPQSAGHPDTWLPRAHSVLTRELIDEPGEPTLEALQKVLRLFASKLL